MVNHKEIFPQIESLLKAGQDQQDHEFDGQLHNKMFKLDPDEAFDMDTPVLKNDSVFYYQLYSYNAIQPDIRYKIELQVEYTCKHYHAKLSSKWKVN